MGNGEDVAEDGEEEDADPVDVLEVADKVELEEDVLVGAELEEEQGAGAPDPLQKDDSLAKKSGVACPTNFIEAPADNNKNRN